MVRRHAEEEEVENKEEANHNQVMIKKQDGSRKPFDKSKVQCYNFQDFNHFSDECKNEKKPRVQDESANLTIEEFSLLWHI